MLIPIIPMDIFTDLMGLNALKITKRRQFVIAQVVWMILGKRDFLGELIGLIH
jgi:hypothetical protein